MAETPTTRLRPWEWAALYPAESEEYICWVCETRVHWCGDPPPTKNPACGRCEAGLDYYTKQKSTEDPSEHAQWKSA